MAKKAAKPLTKSQLMAHLAEQTGISKRDVAALWDALLEIAYKEAKRQDKGFTMPGIGKLVVVKRKARLGRNPMTGESIKIPARKALKFRVSKQAKDSVLG